jgi:hypothetical protein
MPRSGFAGIGGAIVVALVVGCAGGAGAPKKRMDAGGDPATGFPTPDTLEELADEPILGRVFNRDAQDVEVWELEGPFPERVDERPFDDSSPWSALLADAVERRAGLVVPTEAMMGGAPSRNLERYITARCQTGVERISVRHLHAEIGPGVSEAALFARWRESFEAMIADQLVGGPMTAGVWFGRSEDRVIALVVSGTRAVRLEMNHGRYGTTRCEPEPGVDLPRFHFVCEANPNDTSAWLVLDVRPTGRLLGRSAANLLVWPTGETDNVYRRPSFADADPVESEDAAVQGFVTMLNSWPRARPRPSSPPTSSPPGSTNREAPWQTSWPWE